MNKRFISEMFKVSYKAILRSFLIVSLIASSLPSMSQDAAKGKEIFEGKCASCHSINDKLVGPALKDVDKRRDEAWLIKWVHNSTAMIKAGDPVAVKLFQENNQSVMTSFEDLSDNDIKDVIAYIKKASAEVAAPAATTGDDGGGSTTTAGADSGNDQTTTYILMAFALVLVLTVLLLWRGGAVLKRMVAEKHPEEVDDEPGWVSSTFRPWLQALNPTIATMVVVLVFVVAFGGWFFTYGNTEIGVQQDYAPTQPINFSHELHAGQYKIDCQYCHSSASISKQASVPAVSTCMNCHKYIAAKEKYAGQDVSPEIQKIRTAYETNTPVKWVRIHNLPDHAYFNHSQHVGVGKVECQACHGPVEKMAKVAQHASLQMGWCINCHRESKVDVANNDFYEQLHADLKKHGKKTISVAKNGGLECGKCHY